MTLPAHGCKLWHNVWLCAALVLSGLAGTAFAQPAEPAQPAAAAAAATPEAAVEPDAARFLEDLQELTRNPHRLAGTPFGRQAADYVQGRLRALGIGEVFALDMPVWQTHTERCELRLGQVVVPLLPLRPNVVVPPHTAPEGVSGPLLYAGTGSAEEFGQRSVEGALVVLDYDSQEGWERALAWGARAVLFLGDDTSTPHRAKHAGVPSNQLRLYVPPTSQTLLDLRRDYPSATLVSQVAWTKRVGRNLFARIPGTDPAFGEVRKEPEALVLGAAYDSFGEVPEHSAGARAAANVAALLEAAGNFRAQPSKRDIVLAFFDNQGRGQQGARETYASLRLGAAEAEQLARASDDERLHVTAMRDLLQRAGLVFREEALEAVPGVRVAVWLKRELTAQANNARDDLRKALKILRLQARNADKGPQEQLLDAELLRWDEVRRALHQDQLQAFVQEKIELTGRSEDQALRAYLGIFEQLQQKAIEHFDRRLQELEQESSIHAQRMQLRTALGFTGASDSTWVALHVTYAFSDAGPHWGIVVGDWSNRLFSWRAPRTDGDTPGYYGRVLNAFSEARRHVPLSLLDERTLAEPTFGTTFAPGPFVSSGAAAGTHGIYNVSLMTGYDARARDGHPSDTPQTLDWQHLRKQALEATRLISELANRPEISLPAVFKSLAKNKWTSWSDGQSTGDYAALQVSGSLSENRPATGAMMALWPGNQTWTRKAWATLTDALQIPSHDPIMLEPVNEAGRFRVIAAREDLHSELMTLGALFDPSGALQAVSTTQTQAQKLLDAMRVNLIAAQAGAWTTLQTFTTQPDTLQMLKGSSDALFLETRALWGGLQNHGFFFISDQVVDYDLKLFQPMGPVVLGEFTREHPFGKGLAPQRFAGGTSFAEGSAHDLWGLNERRLHSLRSRGVTSADLELLHSRAQSAERQAAVAADLGSGKAALARSSMLSHRVYLPLRTAMDDLVHAIVILLLLAIPFAFAMERLVFCATTIYGRIAGFTGMFLATFLLLYWLHPGFAIASTPMIVFLAFAIVLLSSLVTYIIVRKFKTELRAMQGQAVGLHDLQVSRAGTLLAAASMGMSTMRRRPLRTALTAITVVMLTFTILSFASFTNAIGIRSVYEGPLSAQTAANLLIRKVDYSAIPQGTLDMLRGTEGEGGLIAGQYWVVRKTANDPRSTLARIDTGESITIDAIMGIPPEQLTHWPALSDTLGTASLEQKRLALEQGGVWLPPVVQDVLELKAGDWVLLNGRRVRFAGVTDPAGLQRLRHLDNQSLLPVDFQSAAGLAASSSQGQGQSEDQLLLADEVDKDFVHLNSDQVVIAGARLVREFGGELHSITVHSADAAGALALGQRLAELVVMPVWAAGPEGIERLVLKQITNVSGGLTLFIPLLLGGLIIFGTLLGSISDREKEIYTFSALGLAPSHVGALFFAEAVTYAVVGGMGGQLLAQLVGLAASGLARAGYIQPASINYSSTNSLFAIGVVMATVLLSAIYPAVRASRSANPGLARTWQMPAARGDALDLRFPFTVSAYDITGIVSFLAEHFRRHDDAGLGEFAASAVEIRQNASHQLELRSELALAPFDLGVTQKMTLTAVPSEIEGVDEVAISITRCSGAGSDWYRANRVFLRSLRRQFLLWRTLSSELVEQYRKQTLEALGTDPQPALALESTQTA